MRVTDDRLAAFIAGTEFFDNDGITADIALDLDDTRALLREAKTQLDLCIAEYPARADIRVMHERIRLYLEAGHDTE